MIAAFWTVGLIGAGLVGVWRYLRPDRAAYVGPETVARYRHAERAGWDGPRWDWAAWRAAENRRLGID